MRPTLDETFLEVAAVLARRATCLKLQVGCVLVDTRGRVLSTGYNGVARGMPHCNERTGFNFVYANGVDESRPLTGQHTGTATVYSNACNHGQPFPAGADLCEAVHAEQNALLQCRDVDRIATAYVTHAPCQRCVKELLNTGCGRIVFRTGSEQPQARELWAKAGREWAAL